MLLMAVTCLLIACPQEEARRREAFKAAQSELDFVVAKLLEGGGSGMLDKVGAHPPACLVDGAACLG